MSQSSEHRNISDGSIEKMSLARELPSMHSSDLSTREMLELLT